jgi:hypothetical protein
VQGCFADLGSISLPLAITIFCNWATLDPSLKQKPKPVMMSPGFNIFHAS